MDEPIRYSPELARRLGRPKGSCEICGGTGHPRVRDHCHAHGWVRGVLCNYCNGLMMSLDRGARPPARHLLAELAAYIRHWHNCPDCREIGWTEIAYCVCNQADPPKNTYACTEPRTVPPCPWIGTGFRPDPP